MLIVQLPLIAILLLVGLIAGCDSSATVEVEIVNSSGTRIEKLQISLCGDDYEVAEMEASEVKIIAVEVHCESHFNISASGEDGGTISEDVGYVTPGLPMNNRITIYRISITFEANPSR